MSTLAELLAEFRAWQEEAHHISHNTGPYAEDKRDSTEDERNENDDVGLMLLRRFGELTAMIGSRDSQMVGSLAYAINREYPDLDESADVRMITATVLRALSSYLPPSPHDIRD